MNVAAIALHAGVDEVALVPEFLRDGRLERTESRTTIFVNERANYTRQQFTIAHELGHFFLAEVDGVSLDRQCDDPKVEKFCNWFARELLIPTRWVQDAYADAPRSLRTIEDVARWTCTSWSAAASTLNHVLRWKIGLLVWEREDRAWRLRSKTVPPILRGEVRSAPQATAFLDQLLRQRDQDQLPRQRDQQLHGLPLLVRGELVMVTAEARVSSSVTTLIDVSQLIDRPVETIDDGSRLVDPEPAVGTQLRPSISVAHLTGPRPSVDTRQMSFDWQ